MKRFLHTIKYLLSVVMIIILASCSKEEPLSADELFWQEYGVFENLTHCQTHDYYTAVVTDESLAYTEKGVWCKIVKVPKIVEFCEREQLPLSAPLIDSYIYFKRSDFDGQPLNIGDTIELVISECGGFPSINSPLYPRYACVVIPKQTIY